MLILHLSPTHHLKKVEATVTNARSPACKESSRITGKLDFSPERESEREGADEDR